MPTIISTNNFSYHNGTFVGEISDLDLERFDTDLLTNNRAIYLQSARTGRILLFVEFDTRIGLDREGERQFWVFKCVEQPFSYLSIKLFQD